MKYRKNTAHCCILTGIFLIASGTTFLISWPLVYQFVKNLVLSIYPNSYRADVWINNGAPVTLSVRFFNWTNPDDILVKGVKPRFEEVGPYVFVENRWKVNLTWNEDGTVTFKQKRNWTFDEERSTGKLSDEITTLNAVALVCFLISKSVFLSRRH